MNLILSNVLLILAFFFANFKAFLEISIAIPLEFFNSLIKK